MGTSSETWQWQPGPDLIRELPQGFSITFEIVVGNNGIRALVPRNRREFVLQAALVGEAILAARGKLTPEQRFSYRAMRLVFQLGEQFREHFNCGFRRFSDLITLSSGFGGTKGGHVLPEDLGRDSVGAGEDWSPRDLIDHGRARCDSEHADEGERIRAGLTEAARRNPLKFEDMSEANAAALVRMALFDFDPSMEVVDIAAAQVVEERLLEALQRHLNGKTEEFRKWWQRDLDNIVHAIAKRKSGGVKVARVDVRSILLELVFKSFRYVGDSIHLAMGEVAKSLSQPLTMPERQIFASWYQKHAYLGGLPFILLGECLNYLNEALTEIWADPGNSEHIGVLLRLLDYYGQMARNKRKGDRERKARARRSQNSRPPGA